MSNNTNIKSVKAGFEGFAYKAPVNPGARLLEALGNQPEPPCVDRGDGRPCEFYRRCASELLACKAFHAYVLAPLNKKEHKQWISLERLPTAKAFQKVYSPKGGSTE